MIGYIDLSIIVFLFNYLISLFYASSLINKRIPKLFLIHTFFIHLIAYLLNLFLIPYFHMFVMIIHAFIYLLINIHLFKTLLITIFFYTLNTAFLLLIGGCYLFQGILMISIPYITLFIFTMPFLTVLIQLLINRLYHRLKNKNFIIPCIVKIDENLYKGKGFLDTGNMATFNQCPIIFIKGKIPTCNGEVIQITGIKNIPYKYIAYKGEITMRHKNQEIYAIFVSEKLDFNQCRMLLNKNLF